MNRTLRNILTVVTFVTSIVTMKAVGVLPDTVVLGNYSYVRLLPKDASIQLTDDEFYKISQKITFPVSKSTVSNDAPLLKELQDVVIPLINKDSLTLRHLMIRGAASPEGPYELNKTLSKERGKFIFDFINSRLTVPISNDEDTRIIIPEDYQYLCTLMHDANDADYDKVKQLCDKYLPSDNIKALKSALQKVDRGKLWKRLIKTYFPELRSSRIVIFVEKIIEEPEIVAVQPVQPEKVETPKTDQIVITPPTIEEPKPVVVEVVEPNIYPRREMLSVKTNLLLDFAYVPGYDRWCPIPNVAIEYYPLHGHFTYGASLDFPWWQHYWEHKYFQIRNYQLEARYYLKPTTPLEAYEPYAADKAHRQKPAFYGWYLQGYAHAGLFSLCFDESRGWEGEGIGAGVGIGYVLPISRNGHWRLEFGLQAGFFLCKYDPYQYECPVDPNEQDHLYYYKWTHDADLFKKRQYRYNWIGPTRIGVTLTYDLLYWNKRKINKK